MTTEQFYRSLEEIIEADSGTVTGAEHLKDLKGWDSMAVLGFILMADSKLRTAVAAKNIVACITVEDLRLLLGEKIVD